jgi:predicted 2-oxoglutarate/Fe(II)-dependent dioxygenase YbiX
LIADTSFTTITVNQNFQTAVHTDQGDLKAGLSNILVLRAGDVQGGILVFPHYRAAVRLDTCDLLLFDSHHMHGNTPIFGKVGQFTRVSLVLYYRERMIDCGSAAEEMERAKRRQKGDRLHGPLDP